MIIDIHSHVKFSLDSQNEVEAALLHDMERNGIARRVVSALEGKSIRDQNDYIADFVSRYPDRLIGCAVINPKEFGCVEEAERALALPGMKMLEFNSVEHGYYPDTCPNIEEILEVAERHNVPVKVFTGIGARSMPQQWAVRAGRHPGLKFIFLHIGCFDYGYGCVDLAKNCNNIYVETSNQYEVQILKKAFSELPKEKLIFGSSYPERFTRCSVDIFEMFNLEGEYLKGILVESGRRIFALSGCNLDGLIVF